jgi:hypothetical protein
MSNVLSFRHAKFVVLVKDGNEFIAADSCNPNFDEIYHMDIKGNAEYKLRTRLGVRGGGRLEVDHTAKTVRAYGSSGSYGTSDPEIVQKLLEEAIRTEEGFEGFTLEVDLGGW